MHRITILLSAVIVLMVWSSCRKDFAYTPNPGNLEFSKDTVYLDTVFSKISSSTYSLKVFNPNRDAIEIPTIRLKQGQNSYYRLNVDGVAGKEFANIPILAQDSLYIFIETTVDLSNGLKNEFLYTDAIAFEGKMTTQEVQLVTLVKDAVFHYPKTLADGTKETLSLYMGFNNFDFQKRTGFFSNLNVTATQDEIVTRTTVDDNLVRTTTYENVDGNYRINGGGSFIKSFKLDSLRTVKLTLGLRGGLNRRINFNNDIKYASNNGTFGPRIGATFTWKNVLEINPNYNLGFNRTTFDLPNFETQEFLTHNLRLRTTTYLPKKF